MSSKRSEKKRNRGIFRAKFVKYSKEGHPEYKVTILKIGGEKLILTPAEKKRAMKRAKKFLQSIKKK
jgi:hypothetical protein